LILRACPSRRTAAEVSFTGASTFEKSGTSLECFIWNFSSSSFFLSTSVFAFSNLSGLRVSVARANFCLSPFW